MTTVLHSRTSGGATAYFPTVWLPEVSAAEAAPHHGGTTSDPKSSDVGSTSPFPPAVMW